MAKDDEGRFWVRNQAQAARAAGVKLGRRDVVRVAQLLINDAESAIAEANPAIDPVVSGAMRGVSPALIPSQKVATSEMRTAASVWAGQRDAVEADPEAVVPTRAALIREARQNRQGEGCTKSVPENGKCNPMQPFPPIVTFHLILALCGVLLVPKTENNRQGLEGCIGLHLGLFSYGFGATLSP